MRFFSPRPARLEQDVLARASGLIADRVEVDLAFAQAGSPPRLRATIEALSFVSRLLGSQERVAPDPGSVRSCVERVGGTLAVLSALQLATFALFAALGWARGRGSIAAPLQLATVAIFSVSSLVLRATGKNIPAARALSFVFVGVAAALLGSFEHSTPAWLWPPAAWTLAGFIALPADLVLLVGVWLFVLHFPQVERGGAIQTLVAWMAQVSTGVALALLLVNVWLIVGGPLLDNSFFAGASILHRRSRDSVYWSVVFPLILVSLPLVVLKSRLGYVKARTQVRTFATALGLGFAPLAILSIAGSSSATLASLLRRPDVFPIATVLVFCGLWTIPLTTGWAVATRRVLPLRFILGRTVQYSLARTTLTIAIVLPVAMAILRAYQNREATVGAFVGDGGAAWLGLAGFSLFLASVRERILDWLERRFARHSYRGGDVLTAFASKERRALSAREVGRALLNVVDNTIQPLTSALLLLDADAQRFVPFIGGSSEVLDKQTALVRLLEEGATPISLDLVHPTNLACLLPSSERRWLRSGGWRLLVPLQGAGERLVAVLCLGARTSELPYSRLDGTTLETLAGAAAAALEKRLVNPIRTGETVVGSECEVCGRLYDHRASLCPCGGPVVGSALPLRVAGKYALVRRAGSGGMGVVYEAVDVELERSVALKTLPEIGTAEVARLRNEVRTAAALHHPSVAFVIGLEWCGNLPVAVVEYLAGGTLADRLRVGPLPTSDIVSMGIELADGLDYLHANGVLHRDLKPSNIAFTSLGQPKLLDFGIAVSLSTANERPVAGTALYMPPEALRSALPTSAFDLWGLAVLLLESCVGHHPLAGLSSAEQWRSLVNGEFQRRMPDDLVNDFSGLGTVIHSALSPTPHSRYQSAKAFKGALLGCRS